jgi:hypothetical protein
MFVFPRMVNLPSLNWQEAKMNHDKLVKTDNNATQIPKVQKSLSDYL